LFSWVLFGGAGFELWALSLLGRYCTMGAIFPALYSLILRQ
jgi:hypothetical protein